MPIPELTSEQVDAAVLVRARDVLQRRCTDDAGVRTSYYLRQVALSLIAQHTALETQEPAP